MKSLPLMLSAAGLLAFGGAAHAGNRDVEAYLQRAGAQATAEVAAAGVEVPLDGVRLKGRVGADGRLTGLRVARSSGSVETDHKAAQVLRRFKVANPPNVLVGADVIVTVGPEPIVQAKNP